MTATARRLCTAVRDSTTQLSTLVGYWIELFPAARKELCRWKLQAALIPNATLRRHALETLASEKRNAEGAALFATLAPRAHRAAAVRLLVGYQVMYDYLDTLTEQPNAEPLTSSHQLHRALTAAIGDTPPTAGYYSHYPERDDGGYLAAIVASCATTFASLPAAKLVAPAARRCALRSAACQSANHASLLSRSDAVQRWASAAQPPDTDLSWWETAAAAGSSLATHALFATAADSSCEPAAPTLVETAYWPWIGALNTLLESLADYADDLQTGNHSYVSHYETRAVMATRLGELAERAATAARSLPHGSRHQQILSAMVSYYLTSDNAVARDPVAKAVRARLGIDDHVPAAMLRIRRFASRSHA